MRRWIGRKRLRQWSGWGSRHPGGSAASREYLCEAFDCNCSHRGSRDGDHSRRTDSQPGGRGSGTSSASSRPEGACFDALSVDQLWLPGCRARIDSGRWNSLHEPGSLAAVLREAFNANRRKRFARFARGVGRWTCASGGAHALAASKRFGGGGPATGTDGGVGGGRPGASSR
jgi:hypothetical protein